MPENMPPIIAIPENMARIFTPRQVKGADAVIAGVMGGAKSGNLGRRFRRYMAVGRIGDAGKPEGAGEIVPPIVPLIALEMPVTGSDYE
jgi:hypothetical protein